MVQTMVLLTKLSMVIQCADPFLVISNVGPVVFRFGEVCEVWSAKSARHGGNLSAFRWISRI